MTSIPLGQFYISDRLRIKLPHRFQKMTFQPKLLMRSHLKEAWTQAAILQGEVGSASSLIAQFTWKWQTTLNLLGKGITPSCINRHKANLIPTINSSCSSQATLPHPRTCYLSSNNSSHWLSSRDLRTCLRSARSRRSMRIWSGGSRWNRSERSRGSRTARHWYRCLLRS